MDVGVSLRSRGRSRPRQKFRATEALRNFPDGSDKFCREKSPFDSLLCFALYGLFFPWVESFHSEIPDEESGPPRRNRDFVPDKDQPKRFSGTQGKFRATSFVRRSRPNPARFRKVIFATAEPELGGVCFCPSPQGPRRPGRSRGVPRS